MPSGARLQLDPLEFVPGRMGGLRSETRLASPPVSDEDSPQRAAARAMWQALNAGPQEQLRQADRLAELEERLLQLQREAQEARLAVTSLQARLTQGATPSPWQQPVIWGLLGVIALLLLLVLWLLVDRRRQERQWWADVEQAAAMSHSAVPPASATTGFAVGSASRLREFADSRAQALEVTGVEPISDDMLSREPAWGRATQRGELVDADAGSALDLPEPVPFSGADGGSRRSLAGRLSEIGTDAGAGTLRRQVSVEELIDLEQQAEFFLALEQTDEALDLLERHIRSDAATSPYPFLRLLDLYQRLHRSADYERVRALFNQRFNSHVPAWGERVGEGRSLEDYGPALERLCAAWTSPRIGDILESSLLRHDGEEAFDLAAYRELMLLYAIVREKRASGAQGIDLLLPDSLENGGATSPAPLLATTRLRAYEGSVADVRAVDLELDLDSTRDAAPVQIDLPMRTGSSARGHAQDARDTDP